MPVKAPRSLPDPTRRTVYGLKAYRSLVHPFQHEEVLELELERGTPSFLCCIAGSEKGSYLLVFGWADGPPDPRRDEQPVRRMKPVEREPMREALRTKFKDLPIHFW